MRIVPFKLSNHGENKLLSFLSYVSISWPFLGFAASVVMQNAHGQELLVKFTEQAGSYANPWTDGDGDQSSPRASLHREAGARKATPLLKTPRSGPDALFEASGLSRICAVNLQPSSSLNTAMAIYKSDDKVEYVVPNHSYRILTSESTLDSLESRQWGLAKIRAREGWALERGSRDVIVGIIDTGVDYLHPDLAANIWINSAEDLNDNGRFDAFSESEGGDLNSVDDDGNGFIDDVVGWDFADAPELPGGGDWLERDNDPMDEGPNSHGTHVAGIACAVADNGEGIVGVGPGCTIMALRAGFGPLGYLQEDDVSSAMVYAVQNGARVINMSWGDIVVSPVIHDVISYAHQSGCVLVASAGNSSTDEVHYPSGYGETISVGASDSDDQLMSFSNFGPVIDVVAPGDAILSTFIGAEYGKISGTSMSAPHVSGLAGLVYSLHPEFSNEDVRFAIHAGSVDLGSPGRDNKFGAGRIDVLATLSLSTTLEIHCVLPSIDSGIATDTPIIGTIAGLHLDYWEVSWGRGEHPLWWTLIGEAQGRQVVNDTLAVWVIGDISDGRHVLRIVAADRAGHVEERLIPVWIDRTPPAITDVAVTPMLEGPYWQHLLEFTTDDVTTAAVHMRAAGSTDAFQAFPLRYEATDHRWLIGPTAPGVGAWEFTLSVMNTAGLGSNAPAEGLYTVSISGSPMGYYSLQLITDALPPGYLVPTATDYDADGFRELVIGSVVASEVVPGKTTLGPMRIFETDGSLTFQEISCGAMMMYPLCAGDADQDGLIEILGTYYAPLPDSTNVFTYYGWEPAGPGQFPSLALGDSSNLLAVGMADGDGDGWGEVYGILQDIHSRTAIAVREAIGDNSFVTVDTLWNSMDHHPRFIARGMTSGDFDGDGKQEVAFCDDSGGMAVFRSVVDNEYELWWSCFSAFGDQGYSHAAVSVDLDGDGRDELALLSRLNEELNLEHNFDARRWSLRVFRYDGQTLGEFWETTLYGVMIETGMNALGSGDLNGEGREELAVCAYPDFYIFEYEPGGDSLSVLWYWEGVSTTGVVIDDFDGVPGNELVVGFPDRTAVFGAQRPGAGPLPPGYVSASPVSLSEIALQWSPVSGADLSRVYRGTEGDSLLLLDETQMTAYADTSVEPEVTYWYAVSTVDSSLVPSESVLSHAVSAATNPPPTIVSARFLLPHHVAVQFSERLDDASAKEPGNYTLEPGAFTPTSAVLTKGDTGVLLSFALLAEEDGSYTLTVQGVRDRSGVTVALGTAISVTIERLDCFYLEQARYVGEGRVLVRFNSPPDTSLAGDWFDIEPTLTIERIERDSVDPREIMLTMAPPWRIDGSQYTLTIRNGHDVMGAGICDGDGSRAAFWFFADDLLGWRPAPNPCRLDGSPSTLRFVGAPKDAVVRIWDLAGRLLTELRESNADGVVEWNGRTQEGRRAAPGVYVYHVISTSGEKTGKLVVVH